MNSRRRDEVQFFGGVCCGILLVVLVLYASILPTTHKPHGSHWSLVENAP